MAIPDLSKLGKQDPNPVESDFEPYPSEMNLIKSTAAALQNKFGFKPLSGRGRERFEEEATNRFAEAGFRVHVSWEDVQVDDHTDNLYYIPTISFLGRVERLVSTDHERIQTEVASGELDGRVGYIREDGKLHEDKKRTDLY